MWMRIKEKKVRSGDFELDFFIIEPNIEDSVVAIFKGFDFIKKARLPDYKRYKEQYERQQDSVTTGSISECLTQRAHSCFDLSREWY
jgi:hypothetical protein